MKKYVLIASFFCATFLPIFIVSAGGGSSGGGGKKDTPPSSDCAVRETSATITLEFPTSYNGRTNPVIPAYFSDPNFIIGERDLLRARLRGSFYCTVIVLQEEGVVVIRERYGGMCNQEQWKLKYQHLQAIQLE